MNNQHQDSKFMVTNIDINDLEIRVKLIENQKLKAIAALEFGDFSIKGFRVYNSDITDDSGHALWIVPPSYKDGSGKYHPIFYIPDKEKWVILKKKIGDEYERQSKEYFEKRMGVEGSDDIQL